MSKATLLKIINPLLAINVITQGVTGYTRDSIGERAFGIIHQRGGILLLALAFTHLVLNWSWVKTLFRRKRRTA